MRQPTRFKGIKHIFYVFIGPDSADIRAAVAVYRRVVGSGGVRDLVSFGCGVWCVVCGVWCVVCGVCGVCVVCGWCVGGVVWCMKGCDVVGLFGWSFGLSAD